MSGQVSAVQARRDKVLREKLVGDSGVKRAITKIEERTSGFGFVHRRSLLSNALRLTRSMSPEIADALQMCREVAGITRPIELYIRPDHEFNAFCMKNPTGPVIIGVTSGMIEAFDLKELSFVLGHELAHAAFDHFSIPMPLTATIEDLGGTLVSQPMSLQLYVWCRAAEISADRVGLLCARDADAVARSFFKLSSGVASGKIKPDVEAFTRQVDSLASAPEARAEVRDNDYTLDCFSTHPYSPARVRAMLAFSRSQAYARASGASVNAGLTDDQLEEIVEHDLAIMDPSYLEEKTRQSELMRRLLYNAGVLVAAANGEVSPLEIAALRALLGSDQTSSPINVEQAQKEIDARIEEVLKEVPLARRGQLVQHLTIVAAADGSVEDSEILVMQKIAGQLGVDLHVIDQTLSGASSPMD